VNTAVLVLDAVVEMLDAHGIDSTRDAGAFYPQPLGVLVGLPALSGATLGARTYTVPVYVVSGQPLVEPDVVDALYSLADACAAALDVAAYSPFDFRGSAANAEALPAVQLDVTATVPIPALTSLEG
jgi:hypothetical protein